MKLFSDSLTGRLGVAFVTGATGLAFSTWAGGSVINPSEFVEFNGSGAGAITSGGLLWLTAGAAALG
jgi:hypothetical protein